MIPLCELVRLHCDHERVDSEKDRNDDIDGNCEQDRLTQIKEQFVVSLRPFVVDGREKSLLSRLFRA